MSSSEDTDISTIRSHTIAGDKQTDIYNRVGLFYTKGKPKTQI